MGLEGIVSKRLGSRYVSGRSKDWLKMKNPDAPAVQREAEEECDHPPSRRWSMTHVDQGHLMFVPEPTSRYYPGTMVPRFIPPCLPSPADRPPSGPG